MLQSEIEQRAAFIAEAMTWLGTPFRDCARIKGPGGAVDCAGLLLGSAKNIGMLGEAFDPGKYSGQWHLHRGEEKFLAWLDLAIAARGCGAEVQREAIPGDIIVYRVGRCFSHGGIIIENNHVLHAYYSTQNVTISPRGETELACLPDGKPRPFKLFDLWSKS